MSDEKWLRQAAEEIRKEGHYGWGNTCEQAADRIAELEADRNAWRESAEQLGRQVASLTHNIPTDIPLLGGGDE